MPIVPHYATFSVSEAAVPEGRPVLPSLVKSEELRGGLAVGEPSSLGVCEPGESAEFRVCAHVYFFGGRIRDFH